MQQKMRHLDIFALTVTVLSIDKHLIARSTREPWDSLLLECNATS